MGVGNVQVLHSIVLGSGGTVVQLDDVGVGSGSSVLHGTPAGRSSAMFAAIIEQNGELSFTTTQLDTVLSLLTGEPIYAVSGNTDLHFKTVSSQGTVGTVGERIRIASAALVLDGITGGHAQEVKARCRIIPCFDGTNVPLVSAGSTSVVGTSSSAEHFFGGPIKLSGSEINGVIDWSFDTNPQLIRKGDASELYPRAVYLVHYQPVLRIRVHNTSNWTTYAAASTSAPYGSGALTAVLVYFRKKAAQGGNVAAGTTVHGSLTGYEALLRVEDTSASGSELGVTTLALDLVQDTAGSFPYVLAQGVAIS